MKLFLFHARKKYGSLVRAWRRELDPKGTFKVSKQRFRQFCVTTCIPVSTHALLRSVDRDNDGSVGLEELDTATAEALASFRHWASKRYGSCSAMWDCKEMKQARHLPQLDQNWSAAASNKKLLSTAFIAVLLKLWDRAVDVNVQRSLVTALDLYCCSFIQRSDLAWLDGWNPPEWLCATPNLEAWQELRHKLIKTAGNSLAAWRFHLDVDGSNAVSWDEFQKAGAATGFKGDLAGAWRAVDKELTGIMTFAQFDSQCAELLSAFKRWAQDSFGSVALAFQTLDLDGSGQITMPELKKCFRRVRYPGNAARLFNVLSSENKVDPSGRKCITVKDLEFLDHWMPDKNVLHDLPTLKEHLEQPQSPRLAAISKNLLPIIQATCQEQGQTQQAQTPLYLTEALGSTHLAKWQSISHMAATTTGKFLTAREELLPRLLRS